MNLYHSKKVVFLILNLTSYIERFTGFKTLMDADKKLRIRNGKAPQDVRREVLLIIYG